MNALDFVQTLLAERIGLAPLTLGDGAFHGAIRARLAATGLSEQAWIEHLRTDKAEVEALIEEVVVPETWFFRDEEPFIQLVKHAQARIAVGQKYRVLSLPCATGEEAHSASIALLDSGMTIGQFHVDGIDLSTRALARAARGSYRAGAFRTTTADSLRTRFFVKVNEEWMLAPEARGDVTFRRGNVLDPRLLADEAPYDAIFCRNLLIYFDQASRERTIAHLRAKLAPGGLLFVGHAETLIGIDRGFRRLPEVRAFAYVFVGDDTGSFRHEAAPKPVPAWVESAHTPTGVVPQRARISRPPPPAPVAVPLYEDRKGATPTEPPTDPLAAARALADLNKLDDARAAVESYLKGHTPTADAYHLLGLIAHASGDETAAETCLTRALYLDAGHYPSLVLMALLCDKRGDPAAERYRIRASRAGGGHTP
jgi:chemotaxis protein methyltransferase WspC